MKPRYAALAASLTVLLLIALVAVAVSSLRIASSARAAATVAAVSQASVPREGLVVHEWGTFLAMSGSDGISLDGMYHEEHALPSFVHARSTDQLRLRAASLKGETPVIYFYTNRPQKVRVRVDFPQGIWTQWYPQASAASPSLLAPAAINTPAGSGTNTTPTLRDGRICWNVELTPAPSSTANHPRGVLPTLPPTAPGDLWNHARRVDDAAFVRPATGGTFLQTVHSASNSDASRTEAERFIFYRGLGRAQLPLTLTATDNGTLRLAPNSKRNSSGNGESLQHLFVLRVENNRGAYRYLPSLAPGQSVSDVLPSLGGSSGSGGAGDVALPVSDFSRKLGEDLAARLVESGLYPQEAQAMVNTWRQSYFHTEGVRVLFVLPQTWTDRFIPISIDPKPRTLVRVMVGRLEMLTPERERLAENAVRALAEGASNPKQRAAAFAFLEEQGRYAEPVLRRVLATTKDSRTQVLVRRLLLTPFITELRTATTATTHAAGAAGTAASSIAETDPIHIRARLAILLRDAGLTKEAKAEAQAVLSTLESRNLPPDTRHDARHHLRSRARALEAQGDDTQAAAAYAHFMRFASQVKTAREGACTGCHSMQSDGGPRDMRFFRDWWAGERFAQSAARAGKRSSLIASAEAVLKAKPGDAAAQLQLAYLYGNEPAKKARVAQLWAKLETRTGQRVQAATASAVSGSR